MKSYKIKQDGRTMVISHRDTGATIAEYRMMPGHERAEVARMRYVIDKHLGNGGTLGNYQW